MQMQTKYSSSLQISLALMSSHFPSIFLTEIGKEFSEMLVGMQSLLSTLWFTVAFSGAD